MQIFILLFAELLFAARIGMGLSDADFMTGVILGFLATAVGIWLLLVVSDYR